MKKGDQFIILDSIVTLNSERVEVAICLGFLFGAWQFQTFADGKGLRVAGSMTLTEEQLELEKENLQQITETNVNYIKGLT